MERDEALTDQFVAQVELGLTQVRQQAKQVQEDVAPAREGKAGFMSRSGGFIYVDLTTAPGIL